MILSTLDSYDKLSSVLILLLSLGGYGIAGILAWSNQQWRIKNLETDHGQLVEQHESMQRIIEKQADITHDVELNSRELKQIVIATQRRLEMLENRK